MSTMTLSLRNLLFYLFVSSILTYGSTRRIPRGLSCPSCSQDCPEALTVQLPRDAEELNLRDFSITSYQNSPHFHARQEGIPQDETHDNILLNHNLMFRGNRRFPQQQSNKNYFFENRLNNSPKFLDRQETFSQNKPVSKYPLIVPSRRYFDRPENLYFRNPRNKNSEILSEDNKMTKANKKIEEIFTNKAAYRVDREVKPSWKNSRDTSATQPERPFLKVENIYRLPREDTIDEEKSTIEKSSSSVSPFKYSQERHNPVKFGPSEVERISFNKDTDLSESTEEILDDWDVVDKESSQSSNSNLERLRNNPHILSQHTWKDIENEQLLDNLDLIDDNSQETEELGLYSERNNKYSQDEDEIFQDKVYTSAEIVHAPVINAHNAYIIPRYLNIVNDKNYPIKSEIQELLEIENSVRANSEKDMNQKLFEDEAVIENKAHIQDLIFPKNTFEKEYSNSAANKQNDTRSKIETVTKADLDLSDNVEDLSLETTEILSV